MTTSVTGRPKPSGPAEWWAAHRPLLNTTATLLGATGVTTLVGVVFWWLAAHLVPVDAVGYGSAAVSAMMLIGTFGMAGLNTVLIGHLARHPRDANGLLAAALYTSGMISAALAGCFALAALLVPRLAPYLHGGGQIALFVVGSCLTGATLVLDEALIGLLLGGVQLWRNSAMALAKLGALAVLVMVLHDRLGTSLLGAWTAGTAISIVAVALLLRRRNITVLPTPAWGALRSLGRVSVGHTWLNNALQAPRLALPLVVTGLMPAAASGAFYVAWTIVSLTYLLPYHFTTVLYAVGSADSRVLRDKLRVTLRLSLGAGVIGIPVLIVIAHPLLTLFGSEYANQAALPLQILALGYFGSVLKNSYVAVCRVRDQISRAAWFATVTCVVRLVAGAVGALVDGLPGLAVALLVAMTIEGAAATPTVLRVIRGGGDGGAPTTGSASMAAVDPPDESTVEHLPAPLLDDDMGRPRVRVVYYLQSHTLPEQVARLVGLIKQGSPDSVVLISHDAAGPPLDIPALEAMSGVHVFTESGGYGDFSHLDRYFAAIDWLDEHGIEYDWLENITGQDYPLLSIPDFEDVLARTPFDGYLLYAPVFPDRTPEADPGASDYFTLCAPHDAAVRYLYRHWRFGRPTPTKQKWLRPLMAINLVQPWLRLSLAFSTVGVRRRRTPFGPDFPCYGGWFFCTLSARCVRYVRQFAQERPDVVDFFRTTLAPEESFLQTVLVNAGKFKFHPDAMRYIDLTNSRNNHSNVLGIDDLPKLLGSGAHWARKFDPRRDSEVLDALDNRVRRGPR